MIMNHFARLCCFVLCCFVLSSSCSYRLPNKYYIEDVEVRFVDLVKMDSNGCFVLEEYDEERSNKISGVGLLIHKVFYQDGNSKDLMGCGFGSFPKGMDGPRGVLENFSVSFLFEDSSEYTIDYFQLRDTVIQGINLRSSRFLGEAVPVPSRYMEDCMYVNTIESLAGFAEEYNTVYTEYEMDTEYIVWIEKDSLQNSRKSVDEVSVELIFNGQLSLLKKARVRH